VVAFAPISPLAGAFCHPEPRQAIADPMLRFTPVGAAGPGAVELCPAGLGYAVRQIERPLQVLESRARAGAGRLTIHPGPVGASPEIHNLQTQLVERGRKHSRRRSKACTTTSGRLTAGSRPNAWRWRRSCTTRPCTLNCAHQRVQLAARRGADTPTRRVEELKDMMARPGRA
jgi:hypothetical protein